VCGRAGHLPTTAGVKEEACGSGGTDLAEKFEELRDGMRVEVIDAFRTDTDPHILISAGLVGVVTSADILAVIIQWNAPMRVNGIGTVGASVIPRALWNKMRVLNL